MISGVHVVEDTQGPFRARILITSRNLSHGEVILEIDVTAIELGELMVTSKENFVQTRNSVNTSQPLAKQTSPILLIWPRKIWNILYDEIVYALGWKELPKGLNQNSFDWRSVTGSAMDSPCPGYGVS